MTAITWPTSIVSSTSARSSVTVPATGEGISVSTLSVEISTMGWSTSTVSPTWTSQAVIMPFGHGFAELGKLDLVGHGGCSSRVCARPVGS
jgi:hypothetical protein